MHFPVLLHPYSYSHFVLQYLNMPFPQLESVKRFPGEAHKVSVTHLQPVQLALCLLLETTEG